MYLQNEQQYNAMVHLSSIKDRHIFLSFKSTNFNWQNWRGLMIVLQMIQIQIF